MNFTAVCEKLGVEYRESGQHHHVSAGWVGVDCPLCSPGEGKFKLGYHLTYGSMNCWTCGKMRFVDFVRHHTADRMLVSKMLAGIRDELVFDRTPPRDVIPKLVIPPCVSDLTDTHIDYLKGRKLDVKEIQRLWKVEGIGYDGAELRWRIYIPIIHKGELVSWTTRAISDKPGLRYLSCKSSEERIPHKHLLYGEDYASEKGIVVHEGPFDVYRTGPGAVCTFGTAYTSEQVNRIAKYRRRAICFDSTPDGQKAAKALVDELSVFPGSTYNVKLTGKGKDAGTADLQTIRELRAAFLE